MTQKLHLSLMLLFAVLLVALPTIAQDTIDPTVLDTLEFEITGEVLFVGDELTVGGVVVAPSSAFNPSTLQDGDLVTVTGILLDDDTLQATALVFVVDSDEDGIDDTVDNCPATPNADQVDSNGDGIGDACFSDIDYDGIDDTVDNCPSTPNPDQANANSDGVGDACLSDVDGDGIDDMVDNCPLVDNTDQADINGDKIGDACSSDMDADDIDDALDNCPATFNPDQADADGDGIGTLCDDVEEEGATACGNPNHPVAQRIADEFGVSYGEVMAMHCEGNGFGNIARAFLLGRATGNDDAKSFLDKHKTDKMGWGNIVKEAQEEYPEIKHSDLAPGKIGKPKKGDDTTTEDTDTVETQGNNNNGNGNSNNGNGNSNNGNGNSNNGNSNKPDKVEKPPKVDNPAPAPKNDNNNKGGGKKKK